MLQSHGITGGEIDYESGPYLVSIPAGQKNTLISVPITDDDILERNETFTLFINKQSLPDHVIVDNPNEAMVTILDDDGKNIIKIEAIILAAVFINK